MTQTPDDKQKRQQNDNRNFYDVSFDYPEDESIPSSRRHSSSESARNQQTQTDPELYQKYLKKASNISSPKPKKPNLPPQKQDVSSEANEWQYEPSDKETVSEKSSKLFNKSFKKMKSLFSDLNADDSMKYNPYVDDLPERQDGALLEPTLPKRALRKKKPAAAHGATASDTNVPIRQAAVSDKQEIAATTETSRPVSTQMTNDTEVNTAKIRTTERKAEPKDESKSEVRQSAISEHTGQAPTDAISQQREQAETILPGTGKGASATRQPSRETLLMSDDVRPIIPARPRSIESRTISSSPEQRSALPTPEEIRKERERRRRLRVEELATYETEEEVLRSHKERFQPKPSTIMAQTEATSGVPAKESKITTPSEEKSILSPTSTPSIPNIPESSHIDTEQKPALELEFVSIDDDTTSSLVEEKTTSEQTAVEATVVVPIIEATASETTESHSDEPTTIQPETMTNSQEDEIETELFPEQDSAASTIKRVRPRSKYSLKNFSWNDRIIFGFNVGLNVLKRLVLYIVLIGLLLGSLGAGAGIGYFAHLVSQTPPPTRDEMATQINQLEQLSAIYYANGEKIANVQADVVRSVTELSEVSPFIIDGLIATEDEHFYEHPGVMPKAILRATLQSVLSLGAATGGSTLTQQLVKQRLLTNDVTFFRKANEILLALRLENFFSKDEILIAYLNVSPFGRNNSGENVAGIAKASEGVFGKKTNEVNLPQAAFLVGLPQNPYGYTPYDQHGKLRDDHSAGIERMKEVLFRMYRTQKITKEVYEEALTYDITQDFLPTAPKSPERQSYLYQAMMQGAIEQLMRLNIQKDNLTWNQVYADDDWYNQYYFDAEQQLKTGGYKVYTTIDRQIYDQLQVSAKQYVGELGVAHEGIHVDPETGHEHFYIETVQNGLVIIDNASGKVLGFVSGTDYDSNQIDHAFSVRRSPGSTIKPLAVYGPAIEENIITPATMIPDTAFVQTFEDGTTWTPTNYGSVVSGGNESARVALYKSDNLPAIRVYQELLNRHVDVVGYLEKMGFNTASSYTPEDVRNLSFSIGGVSKGPTVLEETRAFATFANGGQYIEGYYIERIEDSQGNIVFQHELKPVQVFSEDTNYLMVDMLRNTMSEGTARIARGYMEMGGDWIAKTGISENSKDVWMIASTPAITIGSWIGYDSKYANLTINIEDGYGRESERSQLYWSRVINDLYRVRPEIFGVDRVFEQPASVVRTPVLQATGTLPGTVNLDNGSIPIAGPVYEDVFKVSYPAPVLSYNFLFGATPDEQAAFWASYRAQLEEQRRRQQQQSSDSSSSSSSQSENGSSDESSQQNNEQPSNEPNNNNGQ
ncbi:MAG: transglycosylase domain-containing protein [Aerococcaceae bacterium]|nr:transglycosylase domain-containing protein [Aerococcaceae bacterium]